MGREALIESLRARAAGDREAVWAEARAAAERHRAELAQAAAAERASAARSTADLEQALTTEAQVEGRRRAREMRARAALALAARCRRLAEESLPRLREEGGPRLFETLAQELPALEWQRVAVNPGDVDLAYRTFPRTEVACDTAISGGMAVEASGGRIRVSNTLNTRLATAWAEILPPLIGALLPEDRDDAGTA